ncbi:ParB N-terminal domain-containing protein [Paraburkholderia sp. BR14320]|uniref:ParB N-terminal domain-containing protein n=1 Tax=unclassified Paraburkholderia TaxID=2615204 RepID=UPI0034CD967B
MSERYQLLPPLPPAVYASLESSIDTFGIQVPIVVDENGAIIDGHHRAKIAAALGIDCPREVREGLTEEQKMTLARRLNADRRHLTDEQRRAVIAGRLIDSPERSDRAIAADLGVHHTTVGKVRANLEKTGDVANVATRTDTKGRRQPARKLKSAKPQTEARIFRQAAVDVLGVDLFTVRPPPASKPAKQKLPPPVVERVIPPEAVRNPLREFYASFDTHRKELDRVFVAEIDKLGRYAKDPYVVANVKRVIDRISKALDTFRASAGGPS